MWDSRRLENFGSRIFDYWVIRILSYCHAKNVRIFKNTLVDRKKDIFCRFLSNFSDLSAIRQLLKTLKTSGMGTDCSLQKLR